jgi:hypothetical protein
MAASQFSAPWGFEVTNAWIGKGFAFPSGVMVLFESYLDVQFADDQGDTTVCSLKYTDIRDVRLNASNHSFQLLLDLATMRPWLEDPENSFTPEDVSSLGTDSTVIGLAFQTQRREDFTKFEDIYHDVFGLSTSRDRSGKMSMVAELLPCGQSLTAVALLRRGTSPRSTSTPRLRVDGSSVPRSCSEAPISSLSLPVDLNISIQATRNASLSVQPFETAGAESLSNDTPLQIQSQDQLQLSIAPQNPSPGASLREPELSPIAKQSSERSDESFVKSALEGQPVTSGKIASKKAASGGTRHLPPPPPCVYQETLEADECPLSVRRPFAIAAPSPAAAPIPTSEEKPRAPAEMPKPAFPDPVPPKKSKTTRRGNPEERSIDAKSNCTVKKGGRSSLLFSWDDKQLMGGSGSNTGEIEDRASGNRTGLAASLIKRTTGEGSPSKGKSDPYDFGNPFQEPQEPLLLLDCQPATKQKKKKAPPAKKAPPKSAALKKPAKASGKGPAAGGAINPTRPSELASVTEPNQPTSKVQGQDAKGNSSTNRDSVHLEHQRPTAVARPSSVADLSSTRVFQSPIEQVRGSAAIADIAPPPAQAPGATGYSTPLENLEEPESGSGPSFRPTDPRIFAQIPSPALRYAKGPATSSSKASITTAPPVAAAKAQECDPEPTRATATSYFPGTTPSNSKPAVNASRHSVAEEVSKLGVSVDDIPWDDEAALELFFTGMKRLAAVNSRKRQRDAEDTEKGLCTEVSAFVEKALDSSAEESRRRRHEYFQAQKKRLESLSDRHLRFLECKGDFDSQLDRMNSRLRDTVQLQADLLEAKKKLDDAASTFAKELQLLESHKATAKLDAVEAKSVDTLKAILRHKLKIASA